MVEYFSFTFFVLFNFFLLKNGQREKTFGWKYEKAIIGLNQSASTWCGQFHLILCGG